MPAGVRRLGPYMCVPYGKILADEVVPNTVTKTLHADKVYAANMENFSILEAPGYSSLSGQIRTIKSFRRPVILVDDLLHWGHRIHALDHIFKGRAGGNPQHCGGPHVRPGSGSDADPGANRGL